MSIIMFRSGYSSVASIAAGLTCLGLLVGFGLSHSSRCNRSVTTDPATSITHADNDDHTLEAKMADKARAQEMNGHADDDDDGEPGQPDDTTL